MTVFQRMYYIHKKILRSIWRKSPWAIRYWAVQHMWVPTLRHLNVLVTSQCNLRCKFCNIGAQSSKGQNPDANLTLDNFRNLFSGQASFPTLAFVHLSGGEPFLRSDLADLCELFANHCPNAEISLATNGILTERILQFCQKMASASFHHRLGLGISLDGLAETHDDIRGLRGAFQHVMATIREIKEYFPTFLKSISFTVIPENLGNLPEVYRLAKENHLEFYFRLAQESPIYYGDNRGCLESWDEAKLRKLEQTIQSMLPSRGQGSNGADIHFTFYRNMACAHRVKKRNYDCFAGLCSVFIDHQGNIRPCMMLDIALGNIARDPLLQVLRSRRAKEARRYIAQRQCFCWVECETLNSWSIAAWLGMPLRQNLRIYEQGLAGPSPIPDDGKIGET